MQCDRKTALRIEGRFISARILANHSGSARGRQFTLLPDGGEVESRIFDARSSNFDAPDVSRPDTNGLSKFQSTITAFKGRGTALGERIETHYGHADCIRRDGICTDHNHSRVDRCQRTLDPRAFSAGHRFDPIHNRQMDRPCRHQIGDYSRYAVAPVARRRGILF